MDSGRLLQRSVPILTVRQNLRVVDAIGNRIEVTALDAHGLGIRQPYGAGQFRRIQQGHRLVSGELADVLVVLRILAEVDLVGDGVVVSQPVHIQP